MTVLVLTTGLGGPGGVQYATRMLVRVLHDHLGGSSSICVVSVQDTPLALRRLALPMRGWGASGSRLRTALAYLVEGHRCPWDLVVLGHINLAGLVAPPAKPRGCRVLGLVYGVEAWHRIGAWRRRGLGRVDRLVYISESSRRRAHLANPWLAHIPSDVCHLGLGPEPPFGSQERPPDGLPHTPFALSIGRMDRRERYKSYDRLIGIWPRVQRYRPGLGLVLIGEGDDRPRLEQLAQRTGASIRFLGAVEDGVRDWCLHHCQCFCLPSRGEGFGLVYLEAMRAGKSVLAGSVDAGCEVVLDGVTGRTVDSHEPDELLQGVLDVSGERAGEFGRAGRRRFEEYFAYDHFRARFGHQLSVVLGNGSRPASFGRG